MRAYVSPIAHTQGTKWARTHVHRGQRPHERGSPQRKYYGSVMENHTVALSSILYEDIR